MSERRTDRVPFPDARVRPPRLGAGQRVGAAVLAMVFFLVPFAVLGVTSVLLFLAALVPLAVQRAMAARAPRQVSANRHRLFVNGREVLRRRDVSFLYVTRSAQGATLHLLRGADAPIEVELPSEEEAARLIEVMELRELPVSRFRVDSPASSRLPPWLAWGFAAIVVLSNAAGLQRVISPAEVFALLMAWAGFAVFVGSVGAEVAVGDDAVVFRWFGRETVLPLAQIVDARVVAEGVRITLKGGDVTEFHVRFAPSRYAEGMDALASRRAWQEAIVERIERARARAAERPAEFPLPPLAEMDAGAWVDALRGALDRRGAHYREQPLTESQLWAAVENPRAEGAQRAAAAIALGPSLDDAGRARLRIAAEAVATPPVRIAMEAVAHGDDEALVEAVEQVAEAQRAARA